MRFSSTPGEVGNDHIHEVICAHEPCFDDAMPWSDPGRLTDKVGSRFEKVSRVHVILL